MTIEQRLEALETRMKCLEEAAEQAAYEHKERIENHLRQQRRDRENMQVRIDDLEWENMRKQRGY